MITNTAFSIPYEYHREFEIFLYSDLNYPEHGWTSYITNNRVNYFLNLSEDQKLMIALKFPEVEFKEVWR
jgi:hypothetical protein